MEILQVSCDAQIFTPNCLTPTLCKVHVSYKLNVKGGYIGEYCRGF